MVFELSLSELAELSHSMLPSTSGNHCLTASELKGIMPALQKPAQMISGVRVFSQAYEKILEKL